MKTLALVPLGIAHWVYVFTVVMVIVSVFFRRDVIIPSLCGLFLLGFFSETAHHGLDNVIFSLQVVYRGLLNSGKMLFDIMLVIAIMVSLLSALRQQGADKLMVEPIKKLMIGPWSAFFVLGFSMYVAAIFFWPTPSIALVGTVLLPVAMQMGLPAIAAAVSVNIFGHGMALSADPIIQGANRLTATAAGIPTETVLPYALLFSTIAGGVAIALSIYTIKRDIKNGKIKVHDAQTLASTDTPEKQNRITLLRGARLFSRLVPMVFCGVVLLMIYRSSFAPEHAIRGAAATALIGGTAALLLVLTCVVSEGKKCLECITLHIREGFLFSIKIFAPIIPIAGFFFLGHPAQAETVIGAGSAGYLFDIGNNIGYLLEGSKFLLAIGMSLIGILTALDGNGFSGLPLVGSLAAALTSGTQLNTAVLAALGQVTTIFAGGGTLIAWGFGMVADSGVAGINASELARRNFFPCITGLIVICVLSMFLV